MPNNYYPAEKVKAVKKILMRDFFFLREINIWEKNGEPNKWWLRFHLELKSDRIKFFVRCDFKNGTVAEIVHVISTKLRKQKITGAIMKEKFESLEKHIKADREKKDAVLYAAVVEEAARVDAATTANTKHYEQVSGYGMF